MKKNMPKYRRGEYKKVPHICQVCGRPFMGRVDAKTCGVNCRVKLHKMGKEQRSS